MAETDGVLNIQAPIDYGRPEGFPTHYVSEAVIQFTGQEFILYLFQIQHPFTSGSLEDQKQQLLNLQSVKAECIGRYIINAVRMPQIADVMKTYVDTTIPGQIYNQAKEATK